MSKIGIFFGSNTGNTENIAKMIKNFIGNNISDICDIAKSSKDDIEQYDRLLFGIPTWYYGEAQCDWEDFFHKLDKINFSSKIVALFGCGDQKDYTEYFCDAMGIIHDIIKKSGATFLGKWPTVGYDFESSKGLADKDHFIGLAIDEDRQPELTYKRVECWVKQLCCELKIINRLVK